ncbi:MAG TPA: class I SAM-dependent methyltransferase [Xanthomonadales bacterium]|nr:class I SAM-dependent methyltransferase [Xanthomonadales bacterium]
MTDNLEFTGERFTPECVREIWYEHWHRYVFAARFARDRRVIDAACGEGYGSALLARTAASVVGLDVSEQAVAHARSRYGALPNLRFERADVTALSLEPASADVVVSFETLEHVEAQDAMLAGFARALTDDGLLIVSSPDKRTYSDIPGFRNEHHVRELYRDELEALLARHFSAVRLFGQKLLFQSAIWAVDEIPKRVDAATASAGANDVVPGLAYAPLYYVAVCAKRARALPADLDALLHLFGDADESVYTHYNDEVRKHIRAGTLLAEMEQRMIGAEARATAAEQRAAAAESRAAAPWYRRLFGS